MLSNTTTEIRVLLFGPQAALAGTRQLTLTVPSAEISASAVLEALREAAPALGSSLGASRLAVNHEFVAAEHLIQPGDEVALIGMVSGG